MWKPGQRLGEEGKGLGEEDTFLGETEKHPGEVGKGLRKKEKVWGERISGKKLMI